MAGRGKARLGEARQGAEWLGGARQGKARQRNLLMNVADVRQTWSTVRDVWLRKSEATIVPFGDEAVEQLWALKIGELGVGDIGTARNPVQLRLYWTLVGIVAQALDTTHQAVHAALKSTLFTPERFTDVFGKQHVEYPSIALAAMSQAEFNSFFKLAIEMLSNMIGCAPKELREQFNDILDNDVKAMLREGYLR